MSKVKNNLEKKEIFHSLNEWAEEYLEFKGKKDKFNEIALNPALLAETLADDSLNRLIDK